ncbi:TetR family transcriptional regulator [Actinotalea ferrariae]|uniref:TetR/AcrR family transcriptional regulator n=1 Tax=Actinotalea ferrariae TaxID=1386098 RepID=UPI001C8CBE90|nr:TetR/AcrR family transcriptional regulator [Actinotalea ferrariae]MBX9246457.1 TetR family transcriptional regulator [Actinotalea ferrariae]
MQTDLVAPETPGTPPVNGGESVPGLRERQKRARRESLIDAAHVLVEEHGLDGVTVEGICAHAGVSTRTFFNYFESKDDAVLAFEPFVLDPEVTATFAAGGPTGSLPQDLERLVVALVDRPHPSRERIACAMALARREPRLLARQVLAFERHHAEIAALVAARLGVEPGAPRVELLTLLVMALTRATFATWEASGQEGPVQDGVPHVIRELRELMREAPLS